MKVAELREQIKKYDENDLRVIISELYKAMPSKLREDKNIDDMIADYKGYISNGKAGRDKTRKIDLDELEEEIEDFIETAYDQN